MTIENSTFSLFDINYKTFFFFAAVVAVAVAVTEQYLLTFPMAWEKGAS